MSDAATASVDGLISKAIAEFTASLPFAGSDSVVAPVTRGELERVLTGLLAGGGVTVTGGGGIDKAEAERIANKEVADFANSPIFQDVVKRLIEAALQPLKAEVDALVAASSEPEPQKHDNPGKKPH